MTGLFVLKGIVHFILALLELVFCARALLSWFQDTDSDFVAQLYELTFHLTEPLILPMRNLLDRFSWSRTLPIDSAFLFTFLLISFLDLIL